MKIICIFLILFYKFLNFFPRKKKDVLLERRWMKGRIIDFKDNKMDKSFQRVHRWIGFILRIIQWKLAFVIKYYEDETWCIVIV